MGNIDSLTGKLTAIGNAIREKTGKSNLLTLDQMPTEIRSITTAGEIQELNIASNGTYNVPDGVDGYNPVIVNIQPTLETLSVTKNGTYNAPDGVDGYNPVIVNVPQEIKVPSELLNYSGDCEYKFTGESWNSFIDKYGSQITTSDITNIRSMFENNKTIEKIPFSFNSNNNSIINATYMFMRCDNLKEIGDFNNCKFGDMSAIFDYCNNLRYLPNFNNCTFLYDGYDKSGLFSNCWSLRSIKEDFLKEIKTNSNIDGDSQFGYLFYQCYSLDEIIGLNPYGVDIIKNGQHQNLFYCTFDNCNRVKNIIFAMQDDGTPYNCSYAGQIIDLTNQVGYAKYASSILNYNSGITADKEVTDDATYQALKNDPDWFTTNVNYSRYNHDSAVRTINSLPDTSAYLATAGGTNTIEFTGASGSKTDGGAINTLTSSEIAVAAAKGWTVTLV